MLDGLFQPTHLLILLGLALPTAAFWKILTKTGHSGWLGLLFLIPLVGFGVLLWLAFSEWPIERRLRLANGGKAKFCPNCGSPQ
jgi:hypothetical protein